jgi:hypothetical protein
MAVQPRVVRLRQARRSRTIRSSGSTPPTSTWTAPTGPSCVESPNLGICDRNSARRHSFPGIGRHRSPRTSGPTNSGHATIRRTRPTCGWRRSRTPILRTTPTGIHSQPRSVVSPSVALHRGLRSLTMLCSSPTVGAAGPRRRINAAHDKRLSEMSTATGKVSTTLIPPTCVRNVATIRPVHCLYATPQHLVGHPRVTEVRAELACKTYLPEDRASHRPCLQAVTTKPNQEWRVVGMVMSAVAVLLLAACSPGDGSSPASSSPVPIPSIEDYPIVWLETPNLDLDIPDGTFVRGIAESRYLRSQLGPGAYFPGFREASVSNYVWSDNLWPRHDPPHTTYMWVAPFPDPDPQNDPDWHPLSAQVGGVAVCDTSPGTPGADDAVLFTYSRSGRTPPANQRGPRQAPIRNIFGDWRGLDFIDPTHLRMQRCNHRPAPLRPVHTPRPGWPSESE